MTVKDRVPQVRFKGFTETWEQCKFRILNKYQNTRVIR